MMAWAGQSQTATRSTSPGGVFGDVPAETVFVHQSASQIFAGETLYYKVYCLDAGSFKPSPVSKIAYVALVGKDLVPVFQHKVRLKDGYGQGDFFVPATVPTGSYKLIAYTRWMQNQAKEAIFQSDVWLVNPYQNTPAAYLAGGAQDSLGMEEGPITTSDATSAGVGGDLPGGPVALSLDADLFGPREKVRLELRASSEANASGSFSLSVRRIPEFPRPSSHGARNHRRLYGPGSQRPPLPDTSLVLPEMRGEMLSGRVLGAATGLPVKGQALTLSLGGDEFLFEISRTDQRGRFYFNLDRDYANEKGLFQVLGHADTGYTLELDTVGLVLPGVLDFKDFVLHDSLAPAVRARSIQNQVENAYLEVRSDTLLKSTGLVPFYRKFQEHYRLDDFTRFNTIAETLVEIVDHVWLSKDARGEPMFQVRPFDGYLDGMGMPPMVFMDGLFIQDHKDIIGFPARRIKNIFFSRDRYQIGANVFQGILAFETFSSDFHESFQRPFLKEAALFRPQPAKAYFRQEYKEGEQRERIPDFRRQLLWEPSLELEGPVTTIHWFTSDLPGAYEVRLEGFTAQGVPVSATKIFHVD